MSAHEFWIVVHVLLLTYWLGADLGVFYSARSVLNADLAPASRAAVARILVGLDLAPRICLVLMLPVGLTLAADLGLSPVRGVWLILVWAAALMWLALVLAVHRSETATGLRSIDVALRLGVAAVLSVTAIASLAGVGPFVTAWLSLKVLAYAVAVACGIAIRFRLAPFGPALARLVVHGPSAEVEADLASSLKRSYPLVFTIWAALLAATALGVAQP